MHTWGFEALGTAWQVDTATPLGDAPRERVRERVEQYDRDWSRFRTDGPVAELARTGRAALADDAGDLIDVYTTLYRLTDGAMNPLVGASLERLGYDPAYTLQPSGEPVPAPSWDAVTWAPPVLDAPPATVLDVGAAGKGHLVDLVTDLLLADGVDVLTVDGSGDLRHVAGEPLRVALEHPGDSSLAVGVIELDPGRALCASASNRRAWGDGLHHVLDARTGAPTDDVVATWVVADRALVADALATALFLAPADRLAEAFDFSALVITADGRAAVHGDLTGELFS